MSTLNRIKESMVQLFKQHLGKVASPTELGHVKVGENLTIDADGKLNGSDTASKANKIQESWIEATLESNYANVAGLNLRYYKDEFNVVHIEGAVSKSVSGKGPIFTLPEGYRPDRNLYVRGMRAGTLESMQVWTNGQFLQTFISVGDIIYIDTSFRAS